MKNDRMDGVRGAKAARMLFAALAAVMCAGMWGCSDLDREWGPIVWSEYRGGEKVVGFIDDSLVIVSDWRSWSQEQDGFVTDGGTRGGRGHTRLRVFNYRVQENGPRWTDSLDNDFYEYARGQVTDSIIWGSESGSFSFWKLGEKPFVVEYAEQKEGCQKIFQVNRLRIWDDGLVFAQGPLNAGGDSCQYAVLDTVARTLTYKRLDDGLKWIQKCDDVRAWGDDVYCLIRKKENWSVLLSVDDDVVDSMEFDGNRRYAVYPALFAGDMLHMGDYVCSLTNEKMERKPYVKSLSGLKFINADDSIVSY